MQCESSPASVPGILRFHDRRGYTLVELIVVMAIFVVIIALVGNSFNAVLSQASKLFRSEESNIEGVVGLELFRYDLTQAGYGLPSEALSSGVTYNGEAAAGKSASLNDPLSGPPRPLVALARSAAGCSAVTTETPDGQGYTLQPCSDYLALKGTTLSADPASKHWTYLTVTSAAVTANDLWATESHTPAGNDHVVVVSRSVASSSNAMTLQTTEGSPYFSYGPNAFDAFKGMDYSILNVYGITGSATAPRMPFNRVDYFVATPPAGAPQQVAAHCATGAGILYKAAVRHDTGLLQYIPIMDCVGGMWVSLGWDTDGDGIIDTWSNADGTNVSSSVGATQNAIRDALLSPSGTPLESSLTVSPNLSILNGGLSIRNNLKMIKIFVLAQNGKRDPNYTSPASIQIGDTDDGLIAYTVNVAANGWRNYRWKLYRIAVVPKNLLINQ